MGMEEPSRRLYASVFFMSILIPSALCYRVAEQIARKEIKR
jgi:hypothetical protein